MIICINGDITKIQDTNKEEVRLDLIFFKQENFINQVLDV